MLERFSLQNLLEWHNQKNRKPLLMRGARQVGKTTLVRMLAERLDLQLIEINLEKPWNFIFLLKELNPVKIIEAIEFELNVDIDPLKSIIFFDEVQQVPEVLPLMRYFYEEVPQYAVIVTGSLLDFVLSEPDFSIPVGRIELFYLNPLTFEEFLLALGEKKAFDFITNYHLGDEISDTIHERFNKLLRSYSVVGGMPEAVAHFNESGSMKSVERIKTNIVETFRLDFNKYRRTIKPEVLTLIFDKLPRLMGKKLVFSHIDNNYRSNELSRGVSQLATARLIARVFHSSSNGIPLSSEKNDKFFKVLLLDIGLLLSQLKINPLELDLHKNLNYINNGVLAEQFIGQQLYASNDWYSEPEIYYWIREKKASSAEVDYVISSGNRIIPVEVKSGSTGSLRSLHQMVFEKSLKYAVRFNSDFPSMLKEERKAVKGEVNFTLLSLPHYLVQQTYRLLKEMISE